MRAKGGGGGNSVSHPSIQSERQAGAGLYCVKGIQLSNYAFWQNFLYTLLENGPKVQAKGAR